jgi:glutaredoxin
MKKTVLSALLGLCFVGAAPAADMTIYYSPTCPHCHHAKDFTNNNFIYEYPTITVTTVDVTVPEHRALFMDVLKSCDFSSGGVPVIKIGEKCFQGFGESMADELRAAIEVDLGDDAKKSAADVKKAIAADGDKYRSEHPTPVATVTEYFMPASDESAEKKTDDSSSNVTSWTWAIVIFALLVLGVAVSRKKSKK